MDENRNTPYKTPHYAQLLSIPHLNRAWQKVKAKGSRGGIDGMGIKEFEAHEKRELRKLLRELETGRYQPQPYLEVAIPKNETEKRRLGMLSIRDKVVQQAVLFLVGPVLNRMFLSSSYAYRPRKGHQKAVQRVRHMLSHEKKHWLVREDIDDFFDTVDHGRLETALRAVFSRGDQGVADGALVNLMLLQMKMGRVKGHLDWQDVTQGIPQGGLLSPVLANLYLHPLDEYMTQFPDAGYIRYGDDFLILCSDQKRARTIADKIRSFIPKTLGLQLNPDGDTGHAKKGFDYLGIRFYPDKITLSHKKQADLTRQIQRATRLYRSRWARGFRETTGGIGRYYARVLPEPLLKWLDETLLSAVTKALSQLPDNARGRRSRKYLLDQVRFYSETFNKDRNQLLQPILNPKRKKVPAEVLIEPTKLIRKRKQEYRKRFTASMELVINRPGVFLGISRKGVSVRKGGEILELVPAANLRYISVLSRGVSFSSNLVQFCAENTVPLVFFNRHGKPAAGVRAFEKTNTERWTAQFRGLENGKAAAFSKAMVSGKILNQHNLLKSLAKYYGKTDPEFAEGIKDTLTEMQATAKHAKTASAKSLKALRQQLLHFEATAAKRYWERVRILIRKQTDFPGRIPRHPKDLTNALLNYGYGILYQRIHDGLLRAGLNPAISFLHVPNRGKPTLTYDLIEEFRTRAVDSVVLSMLNRGEKLALKDHLLDDPTRKRLAEKVLERLNTAERFRGERLLLGEVIRLQARQ
ncbi:MAG: CRISPR-associated endonuclease Cas1, partial [Bacteroidota bacterium]